MYNDFLSNNDDDLFNFESSSKESFKQTSKSSDEILKDIEKILKDDSSNFFNQVEITSKIVNSFNDSANRYVFSNDSYNRSLFDQLNILTDGLFSYRVYADILEASLAKRFIVFDFLNLLANEKDEKLLKLLTEKIKLNVDFRFINTYIISLLEMLNFAINYNIDIYVKVCQKIDRIPLQQIVDRNIDDVDLNILNSNQYINTYFSIIRDEIGFEF